MLPCRPRLLVAKPMNFQHIVVFCSCPDEAVATRLANALVGEGLTACVNRIAGVRSTYVWDGVLHDEPEVLLTIKTVVERYPTLEARIRALHPYEEPEIIALPVVAGSAGYLDWVTRGSTGSAAPPAPQRPAAAADR